MTRRYICHHCSEKNKNVRRACAFRGYTLRSLKALPNNLHLNFPAILTYRIGIDKLLVDLMRSLFDGGIKPNRFRQIINELHHKEHMRLAITHESKRKNIDSYFRSNQNEHKLFSSFYDKKHYNSFVPTRQFFSKIYANFMNSMRKYLDNDVKKVGGDILHIDVSYKGAKKFAKINGQPIVKGLVTVMNEF